MTTTHDRTEFTDLLIINDLVAEINFEFMKAHRWTETDFNDLTITGIYGDLLLRKITKEVLLQGFCLIVNIE